MQLSVMLDSDNILNALETKDFVNIIEQRPDKNEILEAFSNQELIAYIFHNKIITEDILAQAIEAGQISLELLLGKVAAIRFQRNIDIAAINVVSKKS